MQTALLKIVSCYHNDFETLFLYLLVGNCAYLFEGIWRGKFKIFTSKIG